MKTKTHAPENPYVANYHAARREWNERYGDLIQAKRDWQLTAVGTLALAALLALGLIWQGAQSRIVPYVVEVDELGQLAAVGPAERSAPADSRILRAQVASFVTSSRSVIADRTAQKRLLEQVYAFVAGAAQTFLDEYYGKRSPFDVMKERTISVDVGPILELSDETFQVQWREIARSLEGRVVARKTFQGIFTVRVDPPRTENRTNPLGIFITHISWTEA